MSKITNVVKNSVVYTLGALTNAELTAITNDIASISGIATANTTDIATVSGIATGNTSEISGLKTSKQDKLSAGTGIEITDANVINVTLDTTVFIFVDALPTEGIKTDKIYVVKSATGETGNMYTEYYYKDNAWEKIGEFKADVDLTDYYKKSEVDALLSAKTDNSVYTAYTAATETTLSGKANSNDVYTKTETYSKEEVDAIANGKIVYLTLAEYEALTEIDPNTSYFIYG